jgi:drug/metabolite transporter (DMT)-like permease
VLHIPTITINALYFNYFLLNFVAILWGTQHVVIKTAVETFPSTSLVNFWRFLLSSLLFLPSLFQIIRKPNQVTILSGLELGIYTFLGFAFQAIGLETTTASRSAFLLYLNVKIVPFLAAFFLARKIPMSTWISAFLAFSGTALLSTDGEANGS